MSKQGSRATRLLQCLVILFLPLACGSAVWGSVGVQHIVSDDFQNGLVIPWDRNNGSLSCTQYTNSDANFLRPAGQTYTNTALRFRYGSGDTRSTVGILPSPIALGGVAGESIRLTFDFGYRTSITTGTLRFGLYNSNGTAMSSDPDTLHSSNDFGYFASFGVGGDSAPAVYKEAGDGYQWNYVACYSPRDLVFSDLTATHQTPSISAVNTKFSASLTLTRTATGIDLLAEIFDANGTRIGYSSGSDTSGLFERFDEIVIGTGSSNDLIIDNLSLDAIAPLAWAPPALTSPTTINVSNSNRSLNLDVAKDYIIKMPSTPLTADGGLSIVGGRNIVLNGGEIRFDTPLPPGADTNNRRGLYIKQSTGTVHVEGLLITGAYIREGIDTDLRDPQAVFQLQNVRVDTVTGSYSTNHADVYQTWGGPSQLRIDHLTGRTGYQGLFFQPAQYSGVSPELFTVRNTNILGNADSAYLLWQNTQFPLTMQNVWADSTRFWPSQVLWPMNAGGWQNDVQQGVPSSGDFVTTNVGIGYVSPGYKVDDSTGSVTYSASWAAATGNSQFFEGTEHYSNTTNAYAQYGFMGTAATWLSGKGPNRGKADVYIDNVLAATVDLYAEQYQWQNEVWSTAGLSAGSHTLKIVVRGDQNPASSGHYISMDGFEVQP